MTTEFTVAEGGRISGSPKPACTMIKDQQIAFRRVKFALMCAIPQATVEELRTGRPQPGRPGNERASAAKLPRADFRAFPSNTRWYAEHWLRRGATHRRSIGDQRAAGPLATPGQHSRGGPARGSARGDPAGDAAPARSTCPCAHNAHRGRAEPRWRGERPRPGIQHPSATRMRESH